MTDAEAGRKRAEPGPRGSVLVVDDDEISREIAADIVSMLGYEAHAVDSSAEFLRATASRRYDAVLLDWHLPDLSGLEAARRYREQEDARASGPRTPLIAITGNSLSGDRERCLEAGMDDYLPKPFRVEEMQAMLARWVTPRHG